jgi:opacity protein-like surface antigen
MPSPNVLLMTALAMVTLFPLQSVAGSLDPAETEPPLVEKIPMKSAANVFEGFSIYAGISSSSSNYDININTRILGFENSLNLPDLGGQGYGATVGLGYDRMLTEKLLVGVFLDYVDTGTTNDYSGTSRLGDYSSTTSYTLRQDYLATVGARFGHTVSEGTLIYGMVGYSASRFSGNASYGIANLGEPGPEGASEYDFYNSGVTIGVGIETQISEKTSIKLEARETKFKSYDLFQLGGELDEASMSGSAEHGSRSVSMSLVRRF